MFDTLLNWLLPQAHAAATTTAKAALETNLQSLYDFVFEMIGVALPYLIGISVFWAFWYMVFRRRSG